MAEENKDQGAAQAGTTKARRGADATATRAASQKEARSELKAQSEALAEQEGKRQEALSQPAEIGAADASAIAASGAIMEPEVVEKAVDVSHPAVDNNPRSGTTIQQNLVDFNDPTKDAAEATQDNLDALKR